MLVSISLLFAVMNTFPPCQCSDLNVTIATDCLPKSLHALPSTSSVSFNSSYLTGNPCRILVTTAPENSLQIDVESVIDLHDNPSYANVISKNGMAQECSKVVALNSCIITPCTMLSRDYVLTLFLQNVDAAFTIIAVKTHNKYTGCATLAIREQESSLPCNLSFFDGVYEFSTISKDSIWSHSIRFARFDIECPHQCICSLNTKAYLQSCVNAYQHKTLIVYSNGITGLNFSDIGLHAVTKDAFQSLAGIISLELDNNNIRDLHRETFLSLTKLVSLSLNNNMMKSLPPGVFNSLINLIKLQINCNMLSQLPNGVFHFLLEIRELDISSNHLTTLPFGLFRFNVNLKFLSLRRNHLTQLRGDLFEALSILLDLDIAYNDLIQLPSGIMKSLYVMDILDLRHNNLQFLPFDIFKGNRTKIVTFLNLSYNFLCSLPVNLLANVEVGAFYASHNCLFEIPEDLFRAQRQKLVYIHLNSNRLSYLANSTFQFVYSLQELVLSDNVIYDLPHQLFGSLNKLQFLSLRNNRLIKISSDICHSLHSLQTLSLENNFISLVSKDTFISLQTLEYLDISNNVLQSISQEIFKPLSKLKNLNLAHNYINVPLALNGPSDLEILDVSNNSFTQLHSQVFNLLTELIYLKIAHNHLHKLPSSIFKDLASLAVLDLSFNNLETLEDGLFNNLTNLIQLNLAGNLISNLDVGIFKDTTLLVVLEMQENRLSELQSGLFNLLNRVYFLNCSWNNLQTIKKSTFDQINRLQTVDLRGNELKLVDVNSFEGLQNTLILVEHDATCCFISTSGSSCVSENPRPVYLTCDRLLPNRLAQLSMWILGLFALLLNGVAFCVHRFGKKSSNIQTLLILNLSVADLLMGVNMLLLASADVYFGDKFPSFSDSWRTGIPCKLAGMLSIISSEASVLIITLITADRLLGILYPFKHNLNSKPVKISLVIVWLMSLLLGVLPLILSGFVEDVYEVSEVCIGVPMVRRPVTETFSDFISLENQELEINYEVSFSDVYVPIKSGLKTAQTIHNITYSASRVQGFKVATIFSIVLFIGVNLFCFLFVAVAYISIFVCVFRTARKARRTQQTQTEVRMAVKMFAIVFTDFCCWVPTATVCTLAQCGVITVSPDVYVWTVAFIMPINSSLNPFLYTLVGVISANCEKRKEQNDKIALQTRTGNNLR